MPAQEIKKTLNRIALFFTRDRRLMLLSLGLSLLIWVPSKLNKTYRHRLDIPITVAPSEDLSIAYRSDDHAIIELSGRGARLIGLDSDIEEQTFVIGIEDATAGLPFILSSQAIAKAIRDSFSLSDQVSIQVQGAGITYRFDQLEDRVVPIALRHDIRCAAGYGLVQAPSLQHPSVTISGPSALISSIDTIYTQEVSLDELKETTALSVGLDKGEYPEIKLDRQAATIVLHVAPLVDHTMTLTLPDYESDDHIWQLYPDHIDVHLAIPAPNTDDIKPSDIRLTYKDIGQQTLLVEVAKVPIGTNYLSHSPRMIRYFEERKVDSADTTTD